MARTSHVVTGLEDEYGEPIEDLLQRLLNEYPTQKQVADQLGISQATVSRLIREHGLIAKTVYIKIVGEITL